MRYKLNLTVEKMSPVLKGTMEVRVVVRDAGTGGRGAAAIVLDWRKIRGHEEQSTISNVSINDRVLSPAFTRQPSEGGTQNGGGTQNTLEESNEHLVFRDGVVVGENVIKLDFTSPILATGSAITRYIDKEDGSEYIYSLFVPSDASTAFPVFDQPDLKARFTLEMYKPEGWSIVSNAQSGEYTEVSSDRKGPRFLERFVETRPISSYVFAFAAGPLARVDFPRDRQDDARDVKPALREAYKRWLSSDVSISLTPADSARMEKERVERLSRSIPSDSPDFFHIYVRKSQLAKFQPHAAEVFRLNREGIRFLEE